MEFLDQVDSSGSETQVKVIKGSLERQKKVVDRGSGKLGLRTRLSTLITSRKWAELETEIKQLSVEQREDLLKLYDPSDPANAL